MSRGEAFIKRCIAEAKRFEADLADEEADRLEALERARAIVAALDHYGGELWTRCSALAFELSRYASTAWRRERDVASLSESASPKRRALHRLLRSRDGKAIGARRIYNVARSLNSGGVESSTVAMPPSIRT